MQCRGAGRPIIVKALYKSGVVVGHKLVRQNLLRKQLRTAHKRPLKVTTESNHDCNIEPDYLARRFKGWPPNRAWIGDVNYIQTGEGWLYLAVVVDLCRRKVVG